MGAVPESAALMEFITAKAECEGEESREDRVPCARNMSLILWSFRGGFLNDRRPREWQDDHENVLWKP